MSTQKSKASGGQAAAKSPAQPTKRTSHSSPSKKKTTGNGRRWLMYGGIAAAAAAVYGLSRIPVVRTMVLPVIATAVSKNWSTIKTALQKR